MRDATQKFDDDNFPAGVISPEKEPVRARLAIARYEKARRRGARCTRCLKEPRDPMIETCGFCFYRGKEAQQPHLGVNDMCDDCAFRPDSPEFKNGIVETMILRGGDRGDFLCHKPFLTPRQQWGMEHGRIVLISGAHWRMCAGYARAVIDADLGFIKKLAKASAELHNEEAVDAVAELILHPSAAMLEREAQRRAGIVQIGKKS